MTREYIIMPEFERQWKAMGQSDTELKYLQEQLLLNPQQGPVMKGTGGLRKIRVAFEHQGKSGSGRVVYVDFPAYETIYLVSTEQIPIFAAAIKSAKSAQTGAKGYAGFYADSTLQSTWQA